MKDISILIPTYNDPCDELVSALQRQAAQLAVGYEIIVADDGSTREDVKLRNRSINLLDGCRVMEQPQNMGRSAIRNFLAQQARYDWVLFIDGDMVVKDERFLLRYAETADTDLVVDGGVSIGNLQRGNLRSMYEKAAERQHTADQRQQTPYQHFHTANVLVQRDVMLQHPFDERLRYYGYEDVLFGKQLRDAGIGIRHIDNPLSFEVFEDNAHFVSKTEEGLRTLHHFRQELEGYNGLLSLAHKLRLVAPLIRLWHRMNGPWERNSLTGSHPKLMVFNAYRLGYFMSLR